MSKEINYGEKDVVTEELDIKQAKVKVSMFLDGDLLTEIKEQAKLSGVKYQTFINQTLRQVFMDESTRFDSKDYSDLKKRVTILEQAFLKKSS